MSDKRVSRSYPFSSYYSGPDEDEQESATEADSSPTPLPISDSDVIGSGQECEEVQESAIEGPSSSIPDSDDEDDAESGDVVSRLLRD
ncbi:hypothetical protein, partial [Candidatus Ichthyocystis hellenicum]|uniref:hypothetical protein n=1 Tax=Candidatus Ichthyocystis hellenicum TaxID=1561003 RepID=UPI001112A684